MFLAVKVCLVFGLRIQIKCVTALATFMFVHVILAPSAYSCWQVDCDTRPDLQPIDTNP